MGILMDLGVSSPQLDRRRARVLVPVRRAARHAHGREAGAHRGRRRERLRRGRSSPTVIARYGEERFARRIAHAIVAARPLHDDARARRDRPRRDPRARRAGAGRIPARRTFQAIRMEVNRELPNLADGLDESVHVVGPRGPRARARVPLARGPHGEGDASRGGPARTTIPRRCPPKLPVEPVRRPALARP